MPSSLLAGKITFFILAGKIYFNKNTLLEIVILKI
nr:MAG TPA: hypothetical protein [Caudoviricetes sp.]